MTEDVYNPADTRKGIELKASKQILVEGQDDRRLFNALAKSLSILDVQIHAYCGKDRLSKYLKTFVALPSYLDVKSLAIVADADSNSKGAEDHVRNALNRYGLEAPSSPLQLSSGSPRVCYLIIPHESPQGALEDVCLDSVKSDPAIKCVNRYLECIRQNSLSPNNESKAQLHTFLASRRRPGFRLGEAAEKGIWDFEAVSFRPLKDLLTML